MKTRTAFYWDTSALLALIFDEKLSQPLRKYVSQKRALPGYTSFFTLLEMESGLSRRIGEGFIKTENLAELRLRVQEFESLLALIWPDTGYLPAGKRFISEFGLRPGDAMQLVAAKTVKEVVPSTVFLSLDAKLNQAALAVDLEVVPFAKKTTSK